MSTIAYTDSLLLPALIREVKAAKSSIQIMTFIWKTDYAQPTAATEFFDAVVEAHQQREVEVFVNLNASRFEPDVAAENYITATKLADAGCTVRLGPRNQTLHTKLIIIDLDRLFIGSHNLTRGGLGFNREGTLFTDLREVVKRLRRYYNQVWAWSTRLSEAQPPDTSALPVAIRLLTATMAGQEVELGFSVNHTDGVDAFAAVSDDGLDLEGANMGPTVAPDIRLARVLPTVEAGQTVYLAVRAYHAGTEEAESNIVSLVYQPVESPGGDGEPGGGGGDQPPPESLTAPTVTTVTQASPTTVTVGWTFVGVTDFHRFVIQQRNLELVWEQIGIVMDAAAREWTGAANSMDSINPFRVMVYNLTGESATSNEVLLTQPALTAPVLSSVVAGLNGTEITATWTFPGCENFHRFEVQKLVGTDWSVVGSTLDPAVRQWVGPGPGEGFTVATYRVVVFNMAEESAASNEFTITGEPPVPLQPPVLVSVTQIGPMGINVEYSHVTPAEFTRYEVQQRTNGDWSVVGTITTPETRSWSGGPIPYMDADHPVRVVVFVQSGDSAGSNEMGITPM